MTELQKPVSPDADVYDRDGAIGRLGGDASLLDMTVEVFVEELPNMTNDITGALDRQDVPAFERAAHSLKGAAANIGAERVRAAAYELEKVGKAGDLASAGTLMALLDAELELLKQALSDDA